MSRPDPERLRVLVREPISAAGLDLLRARFDVVEDGDSELESIIDGFDAVVIRSGTTIGERAIERATRLKVIARAGVGIDNVDVDAATRRGIVVANAPESTVVSAAEHTIALLLAVARNIPQAHAAVKGGSWDRARFAGVYVGRREDRGHDCGPILVRREQLQAHCLRSRPARPPESRMARERRFEPFFEQQLESGVERRDERHRGSERSGAGIERRLHPGPVEVEARIRRAARALPGRRGHDCQGQARWRHQGLLRAGDDDVQSPGIRLERDRTETRDRVHDDERARLVCRLRECLDVGDDSR